MLRSLKGLKGYTLCAKEEDVGKIKDFYFDDAKWAVKFLVADIGNWRSKRKVLISPAGFYGKPDGTSRTFSVIFPTKEMVEECPDIESQKTVSEQIEESLPDYSDWTEWAEKHPDEPPILGFMAEIEETIKRQETIQAHLRSMNEILGYHTQTSDAKVGHVTDFIIDDRNWTIRFLVIATKNWLPGKEVLVAPLWVDKIRWSRRKIFVDLAQDELKNQPTYDPETPINREEEEVLFDYYGRPKGRLKHIH